VNLTLVKEEEEAVATLLLESVQNSPDIEMPHNEMPHNEMPHNEMPHNEMPHNEMPHNTLDARLLQSAEDVDVHHSLYPDRS
jgi:uncharacterized protein involved in copper resistance